MSQGDYELGMVGLGVMGWNLVLNIAEHGFSVAGYDHEPAKVQALADQAKDQRIWAVKSFPALFESLRSSHVGMVLVPAGPPVDAVLGDLTPYLRRGDIVIDAGDSHFSDTRLIPKSESLMSPPQRR